MTIRVVDQSHFAGVTGWSPGYFVFGTTDPSSMLTTATVNSSASITNRRTTMTHQWQPRTLLSVVSDTEGGSKYIRWSSNAAYAQVAGTGPAEGGTTPPQSLTGAVATNTDGINNDGNPGTHRERELAACGTSNPVSVAFNSVMGGDTGGLAGFGSNLVGNVANSLTPGNPSACFAAINAAADAAADTSSISSSLGACFANSEQVMLASGEDKAISEVQVGDRILTVNAKGEQVFSDVVYLPHGRNTHLATFATIATASSRDLKMTMNHILPAGACALSTLPLVAASAVAVGDCVQTVDGREQVMSVGKVEGKGIYTVIAMEELIVVNGIVATPFGGVNPTLANIYYNMHRLVYATSWGKYLLGMNQWLQVATVEWWSVMTSF